jgi:hypothetical protein
MIQDKLKRYEKAFVAFIDILGFSAKVTELDKLNDKKLKEENLYKLLLKIKGTIDNYKKEKTLFKDVYMAAMSDSIILIVPCDARINHGSPIINGNYIGASVVVEILRNIQYSLLAEKPYETLLRGYVTQGDLYLDKENDVFFGKGFIDAVEGEKNIGFSPRIVIAPSIIKAAEIKIERALCVANERGERRNHIFEKLLQDTLDGHYFIDYLNYGRLIDERGKNKEINTEQGLKDIEKFVKYNLDKYEGTEIYKKYKWLERYLNRNKDSELFVSHKLDTNQN